MNKRKWCFASPPADFGIKCDICGGDNLAWSEYEDLVWCFDCKIDTKGTENLLSGPVPVEVAALLGINLTKINLST